MDENIQKLKQQAEHYCMVYKMHGCTREEAKQKIQPYIDAVNQKSKEIAKKYNQKPKTVSFNKFVR